jgi:hypothetical protein
MEDPRAAVRKNASLFLKGVSSRAVLGGFHKAFSLEYSVGILLQVGTKKGEIWAGE